MTKTYTITIEFPERKEKDLPTLEDLQHSLEREIYLVYSAEIILIEENDHD